LLSFSYSYFYVIKYVGSRFGQTFTEEECEEMFRLSDINSDGKIDWEEFLQVSKAKKKIQGPI
jgi:Ca2+-binding EF-hand superfamily protein